VHGIATTGLLLGGFAPATVLYLVGTHEPGVRWLITTVAIAAAGTIGLARMGHALFVSSRAQATRVERVVLVAIFAVFSAALGQRVWASVGVDLAAMPRGAEVAR
jgi:membrane-associated PAP2 superfamily phosphatase